MKPMKVLGVVMLLVGLAGCGGTGPDAPRSDLPLRMAGSATASDVAAPAGAAMPDYRVVESSVSVPQTLRVSEANRYYPVADIVWRNDPRGDRYAQVKAIFDAAVAEATAPMTGARAVLVDLQVVRFHSLTEKARYSIGGVHSIRFYLTVRDAATQAVIDGPRLIKADMKAAGGDQALKDDAEGRTPKVLITAHLAEVIRAELARPVPAPGTERRLFRRKPRLVPAQ